MPRALHHSGRLLARLDKTVCFCLLAELQTMCLMEPVLCDALRPRLFQLSAQRTNHHAEAYPETQAVSAHLQAWRSSSTVRLSSPSSWISRSSSCSAP